MATFVIATRNRHKVEEIKEVLGSGHRWLCLADLPGAPAVVEDADTFAGNARKKASTIAGWLAARPDGQPIDLSAAHVLADDSGLEVDALNGAPGLHSARYAAMGTATAGNSTDAENNAKLLAALSAVPLERRTARFRCVLALASVAQTVASPNSIPVFDGVCEGRILFAARGSHGFGYDPLFRPEGHEATFAELGAETKNRISHRARALAALKSWLSGGTGF